MTGDQLKEIRIKTGLKQYELADKLGIYASNLCKLENGFYKIPAYIENLINALIKTEELKK